MSLLRKIKQDHDKRLLADSSEQLQQERARAEQVALLASIVDDAMGKLAERLEEELRIIETGYFYQVGDLVMLVELFERYQRDLPDLSRKPSLITMEYAVWILGVDTRSTRLDRIKLGMLSLQDYNGVYKAVTSAPNYLNFDAEAVMVLHEQLDRFR